MQGDLDGAEGGKTGEKLSRAVLKAGQRLKVPNGIKAIVQLPGLLSQVEAYEGAQVSHEQEGEGDSAELYARVGKMKTRVMDRDFYMRTPVVKVTGPPGTIFHLRIVLDATTIVQVEKGPVEVISLVEEGERYTLQSGEEGRFEPRGGSQINKID